MRSSIILVFVLFALLVQAMVAYADNWAVLVAGSNGYWNYRHQADICNAFQLLKANGIPESNIITMMYDDIANNNQNPKKGTIINVPGGPNVYPGVNIDYKGQDVTPANFLKIIQGQDMGGKKTLKSGPNDRVFIYFADHGAAGLIAFPAGGYLYAKDLMPALKNMHSQGMYSQLVFYIEACESGSMFNNLLDSSLGIYGVTASNPSLSSYACDYDNTYKTYLNDCWSRNWLINAYNHTQDQNTYTLKQQADVVRTLTTQSPECIYGDTSFVSEPIGYFEGSVKSGAQAAAPLSLLHMRRQSQTVRMARISSGAQPQKPQSSVDARQVKVDYLRRRLAAAENDFERSQINVELERELANINALDVVFTAYASRANVRSLAQLQAASNDDPRHCYPSQSVVQVDCIKEAVEATERSCGPLGENGLAYVRVLNEACRLGVSAQRTEEIMTSVCKAVKL